MRQMSKSRRRLSAGAFLIVAAPVAMGSVAYACQSLATLHANPNVATAGSTVTLFGKNYSNSATSTNIDVHLDTRTGPVIASFAPASVLSGSATIPSVTAAGVHTLVATQYTSAGNAVSGTPGRATVSVSVAARTSADGVAAPAASTSTDSAATPAAVTPATPAAAASVAAPAASVAAPAAVVAGPAAPAASVAAPVANVASTPAAAAAVTAPAVSAPDAAVASSTPAAAVPASVQVGLLPASSESSSILPGLTLVAGLALVMLGLAAFLKSGRSILGRGFGPLAG